MSEIGHATSQGFSPLIMEAEVLQRYFRIRCENGYAAQPTAFMSLIVKLRVFMGVVLGLSVLLLLSVFIWLLIFLTMFHYGFQMGLDMLKRIRRVALGMHASIRLLWNSRGGLIIGRRLRDQSIQQHDLWDRWLDGS
jgi:hypothetical protein